ncbi:rRNA maturation RNase YbeY [soil metagenome]
MSAPGLALSVQYADPASTDLPDRHQVRRRVVATLDAISPERDSVLTIRFATRREARALNRAHRQADYVPNVLTFALHEGGPAGMPVVADIVICPAVVRAEARAQRKSVAEHMTHMIVHGVLHAHGHDHEVDATAELMESLERFVLRRFRIADPYLARVP